MVHSFHEGNTPEEDNNGYVVLICNKTLASLSPLLQTWADLFEPLPLLLSLLSGLPGLSSLFHGFTHLTPPKRTTVGLRSGARLASLKPRAFSFNIDKNSLMICRLKSESQISMMNGSSETEIKCVWKREKLITNTCEQKCKIFAEPRICHKNMHKFDFALTKITLYSNWFKIIILLNTKRN